MNDPPGRPDYVRRVLDVTKGQLAYVIGTVYMEMPLKPSILEDIAKDVSFLLVLLSQLPYSRALTVSSKGMERGPATTSSVL